MISRTFLLLLLLTIVMTTQTMSRFIIRVRLDNFVTLNSSSNVVLCTMNGTRFCRASVDLCFFDGIPVTPKKCLQTARIMIGNRSLEINPGRAISGCRPPVICVLLNDTNIHQSHLNVTVSATVNFQSYFTHFQHFLLHDGKIFDSKWKPIMVTGIQEHVSIQYLLTMSTMITCSSNFYGPSCKTQCKKPWRILYSCVVFEDGTLKQYCYLQPVPNAKCTRICSDTVPCAFPYHVRVTSAQETKVMFTTTTTTTTAVGVAPTLTIRHSTNLATAAWATLIILTPVILLAIVISPCLLHYCDPKRKKPTKDELKRIKAMKDAERDQRWALPPEIALSAQDPQDKPGSHLQGGMQEEDGQDVGETRL